MKYYHLTDNDKFIFDVNYSNRQQEMGRGLYITDNDSIETWYNLLQGRKNCIELEITGLNIIKETEMPSMSEMVKIIRLNGIKLDTIEKHEPTGEHWQESIKIATKRVYALCMGYNAIEPVQDNKEGYQIVIINNNNITIEVISIKDCYETIRENFRNMLKIA